MRKVRATQNIKRDGELIKEGDTFVVDNKEAKRLEAANAIEKQVTKEEPTVDEETGKVDYSKMSGSDVVKLAKERGVAGASKLSKDDLVDILAEQDEESGESDETETKDEDEDEAEDVTQYETKTEEVGEEVGEDKE